MTILKRPEISKECQALLNELNRINLDHTVHLKKINSVSNFATILQSEVEANPSSQKNSKNEETILDYAEHFRQQYMYLYKNRHALLLTCENEAGLEKFVSTTLRPSLIHQDALFDWQGCAEFVSDAIKPVMLEDVTKIPKVLVSPVEVLRRQEGHCFEISNLLCSLLLGAGYDAFVVSGYATRELCQADETRTECSLLTKDAKNPWMESIEHIWAKQFKKSSKKKTKYAIRPCKDLTSKFDKEMLNKAATKETDAIQKELEEKLAQQAVDERPDEDEMYGIRVHAWVMIRAGRREVPTTFFIDPFSGRAYGQNSDEFLGVESIYNHKNYYINMQNCADGCVSMLWDVNDANYWEALLPHKDVELVDKNQTEADETLGDDFDDEEDYEVASNSNIIKAIKMPESWVSEINITNDMYETRCPSGKRTFYYKRSKLDKFAPYLRADGTTKQLSLYSDLDYYKDILMHSPLEIQEWFENRLDKLMFRSHDKNNDWVSECFSKGRNNDALRRHTFNMLTPQFNAPRIFHYYHEARSDGLFKREITKKSMTEKFISRDDRLISREILYENDYNDIKKSFGPASGGDFSNQRSIIQIIETFSPSRTDLSNEAPLEVQELVYFLDEEKIHVTYHRLHDKVSPNMREFQKPTIGGSTGSDTAIAGTGSIPVWDIDNCQCYSNEISTDEANPKVSEQGTGKDKVEISDKPTHRVLFAQMKDLMISEMRTIKYIRMSEEEIQETLKDRATEERNLDNKLKVSIYDTKRNLKAQERRQELERLAKEDAERRNDQSMDYLAPFLAKAGLDSNDPDLQKKMTRDVAVKLKNDCLYHLKMKMVQKANFIQERLINETKELERRQSIYQRKQAHNNNKVDEEEYVNFCQDSTFRIHILEKRLAEHKKQSAVKYALLEQKVRMDRRLAAFV